MPSVYIGGGNFNAGTAYLDELARQRQQALAEAHFGLQQAEFQNSLQQQQRQQALQSNPFGPASFTREAQGNAAMQNFDEDARRRAQEAEHNQFQEGLANRKFAQDQTEFQNRQTEFADKQAAMADYRKGLKEEAELRRRATEQGQKEATRTHLENEDIRRQQEADRTRNTEMKIAQAEYENEQDKIKNALDVISRKRVQLKDDAEAGVNTESQQAILNAQEDALVAQTEQLKQYHTARMASFMRGRVDDNMKSWEAPTPSNQMPPTPEDMMKSWEAPPVRAEDEILKAHHQAGELKREREAAGKLKPFEFYAETKTQQNMSLENYQSAVKARAAKEKDPVIKTMLESLAESHPMALERREQLRRLNALPSNERLLYLDEQLNRLDMKVPEEQVLHRASQLAPQIEAGLSQSFGDMAGPEESAKVRSARAWNLAMKKARDDLRQPVVDTLKNMEAKGINLEQLRDWLVKLRPLVVPEANPAFSPAGDGEANLQAQRQVAAQGFGRIGAMPAEKRKQLIITQLKMAETHDPWEVARRPIDTDARLKQLAMLEEIERAPGKMPKPGSDAAYLLGMQRPEIMENPNYWRDMAREYSVVVPPLPQTAGARGEAGAAGPTGERGLSVYDSASLVFKEAKTAHAMMVELNRLNRENPGQTERKEIARAYNHEVARRKAP